MWEFLAHFVGLMIGLQKIVASRRSRAMSHIFCHFVHNSQNLTFFRFSTNATFKKSMVIRKLNCAFTVGLTQTSFSTSP